MERIDEGCQVVHRGRPPLRRVLVGSVLALAVLTSLGTNVGVTRAYAQQMRGAERPLFTRPLLAAHPAVDYEHYLTPEECLAALERVADSALWGETRIRRYSDLDAGDLDQPELPAVVTAARRCAARFRVAAAAPGDLPALYRLWFKAAQDSLAEAALARQLELLPPATAPAERAEVVAQALRFAVLEVRSARLNWAERLFAVINHLGGWEVRVARLLAYDAFQRYGTVVYDTSRIDRYTSALLALVDSLPPGEKQRWGFAKGRAMRYQTLRRLARGESLPPARQGQAAPLEAAFWFGRSDPVAPRPSRGRAGLVVFVDAQCNLDCYIGYALLRDLRKRLGTALEVTLVAHTHGYFRSHPPLAPAQEAELLQQYFLEHLKLPGALTVEATKFTHLPPPDRRRIDQTPPNVEHYQPSSIEGFGLNLNQHFKAGDFGGFLVAPDGQIPLELKFGVEDDRLAMAAVTGWLTRWTGAAK